MNRIALVCLWLSLIYLVAAFIVTTTGCFAVLLQIHGSILQYTVIDFAVRNWISTELDLAFHWFWALCVLVGLGILLVAISALWVSLSRSPSAPAQPAGPRGSMPEEPAAVPA
jgi:hypothetical protein